MKKGIKILGTAFLVLIVATSCGDTGETASETEAIEEVNNYTPLSDIVDKHAEFEGNEVTIEGFSWGTNTMGDGSQRMNLGSEKLSGMKQAQVVVDFDSAIEDLNNIVKDQVVVIKAIVGESSYGSVHLINPELISVK